MSTSKKILALAAGAAMVLSAGTAAEAARARGHQQAMVPLGMDQVDPSWVVPSFVELAEGPKKVVKMSDKEKANAALAPAPAPAAGDKAPVPSPTTLTAKAPAAAPAPKEEKAAPAPKEEKAAPASKPAPKEEEVAAPAPAPAGEAAAADANAEPTESGAEESEEVVEESSSSSSSDDDSTASEKPDPVEGTMPGHVWVKADNDETNDKKDDYKHIPGVHLLPKGKALERSAATLANIAKAKTEAMKAKDEADSAKAESKVAATEKKEQQEEGKKAESTNAAAAAKEEAKNTVSGPDADKLAQNDAAKDKTVVAVNPAKQEHATTVTKKAIEQTKPKLDGDKKIETGGEVPAAKQEPEAGLEKEKVPAAAPAAKK